MYKNIITAFVYFIAASSTVFAQNPIIQNIYTADPAPDIERSIGDIDPRIYGVFMEPIQFSGRRFGLPDSVQFNTLYGTLYDPESSLADENGFKKNYIEAMKELKITNTCDTFNTPGASGIPYLDVTTTYSKETNEVFINVVNRHRDKAIMADIVTTTGNLMGKAEASFIAGASLNEVYEFDNQARYVPVEKW